MPGTAERIVVVTDIDASLLQPGSRALPDENAALAFLAEHGIPLVINSSRSRAEIERLQQTLPMVAPFISEHGSALFLPHGFFPFVPARARQAVGGHVIEFGRRYYEVADALRLVCSDLNVEAVSLSELSIEEAARELGVSIVEAQLVKLREYTELVRIVDESDKTMSRLLKALRRQGLRGCRRGRHYLVSATPDRAESLRTLKALWTRAWGEHVMVGLGDSEDDVAWLQSVDIPIYVENGRSAIPASVLRKLPTVRVTERPGRRGWSEAIFEWVGSALASRQLVKGQPDR
jgi:mannosyl-3-phosphoglycerate phosphatase